MLSAEAFLSVVSAAPLVSVDLVVVRGGTEILLGLRNNPPAQGFWFAPGGRIRKNETIAAALARIASTELGLAVEALDQPPELLGGFEHFYPNCFAGDVGVSTHYVVLAHLLHLPAGYALPQADAQHAELRWWPLAQAQGSALGSAQVHGFTKEYVEAILLSKQKLLTHIPRGLAPDLMTHRALGGQSLQSCPQGQGPLLYLSPLSAADAPARGGVPVLFPQFADRGPLPKHGMVRAANWALAKPARPGEMQYSLQIAATDYPAWPHACTLRVTAQTRSDGLRMTLQVTNIGNTTFSWTGGLHPYWALDDVQASSLHGLFGLAVQDRYNASLLTEPASALTWTDQPFERLYGTCPALKLQSAMRTLELSAGGFTQWMVWNPGAEGAKALADLPDDDWQRFACIEPVCVDVPQVLQPGERFEGWLEVRVL